MFIKGLHGHSAGFLIPCSHTHEPGNKVSWYIGNHAYCIAENRTAFCSLILPIVLLCISVWATEGYCSLWSTRLWVCSAGKTSFCLCDLANDPRTIRTKCCCIEPWWSFFECLSMKDVANSTQNLQRRYKVTSNPIALHRWGMEKLFEHSACTSRCAIVKLH